MKMTLSPDERRSTLKALGRIKRVTKIAMDAYKRADLETLTADVQLGNINGAITAIETAGEGEDVGMLQLHRSVVRLGIALLLEDIEQIKSRQMGFDIGTRETETRADELENLARRFGEQQELPLTNEALGFPRSSQVGAPALEVAVGVYDEDDER